MSSQVMLTPKAPAASSGAGKSNEASFISAGKISLTPMELGGRVYMRPPHCDQLGRLHLVCAHGCLLIFQDGLVRVLLSTRKI